MAERFPEAEVVAVDASPVMLERAKARAARLGLSHRVATLRADLPDGVEAAGQADLAWASMVLHHVSDEVTALRHVGRLLRPNGVLVLVEMAEPLRVQVADDFGRPGLWPRLDAAWATWFSELRADLGHPGEPDYRSVLAQAGFTVVAQALLTLDLGAPLAEKARQLARRQLELASGALAPYADQADLDALNEVANEHSTRSLARRDDVSLTAARHLFVATAVAGTSA
jgi:SAM-dependent methyltransferase